jgi:hypothetical protein
MSKSGPLDFASLRSGGWGTEVYCGSENIPGGIVIFGETAVHAEDEVILEEDRATGLSDMCVNEKN